MPLAHQTDVPTGPAFFQRMKPASFGGVSFFTVGSRIRFGRRNAGHEYPFRDDVWIEDLGRQGRRIQMAGYLLGDDVAQQLQKLIALAEEGKATDLTHPMLGRLQVALMDAEAGDTLEAGRVVEITLIFVKQGQRQFPSAAASNPTATQGAATSTAAAVSSSWSQKGGPVLTGPASTTALANVAANFAVRAALAGQNATALLRMSTILPGAVGSLLRLGTGLGIDQLIPGGPQTIAALIGLAAAGRQNIGQANNGLSSAASAATSSNTAPFAAAALAVTEAVRASAATPGDAVRALTDLASFSSDPSEAGDAAEAHAQAAMLMQRTAAVSLVNAAAAYRPSTADEAIALRNGVVDVLDLLIDAAGDSDDDTSYQALRTMRSAIVQQLNLVGATLPGLVDFTLQGSVPALALAQRLYQDADRADELVMRSGAVHPAFLPPTTFKVLSA